MRFWDSFAFLTEQISILRSWGDDVVAVTRLQIPNSLFIVERALSSQASSQALHFFKQI